MASSSTFHHDVQSEVTIDENAQSVDVDIISAPQKKRRIRTDNEFIKNRSARRKLDTSKMSSLNAMLTKWYNRTKTPTLALTLVKTNDGQLCVKYSGPKQFEAFGKSKSVAKKFTSIVLEGMKADGVDFNDEGEEDDIAEESGIDDKIVDVLTTQNVHSFSIGRKRKLISQIITGIDMKNQANWKEAKKPAWWPDVEPKILFRSPNCRNPSMRVDEMDHVLDSCIQFIGAVAPPELAEPNIDNTVVVPIGEGIQSTTDCTCSKTETCSAGLNCVVFPQAILQRLFQMDLSCIGCVDCKSHFHKACVSESVSQIPGTWKCGCNVKSSEMQGIQKFRSDESLKEMFRRWDAEIKKYAVGIVKRKVPSKRMDIFEIGKNDLFFEGFFNFYWLLGSDDMERSFMRYFLDATAGIPSATGFAADKYSYLVKIVLFAEVLAFLLHLEEKVPLICAKRIIMQKNSVQEH
eukprot:gene6453-7185_t